MRAEVFYVGGQFRQETSSARKQIANTATPTSIHPFKIVKYFQSLNEALACFYGV